MKNHIEGCIKSVGKAVSILGKLTPQLASVCGMEFEPDERVTKSLYEYLQQLESLAGEAHASLNSATQQAYDAMVELHRKAQ